MRRLLTVAEVAEILRVHSKTVYRWVWSGTLPSVRLGHAGHLIRIPKDDLEQYLEERRSHADRS